MFVVGNKSDLENLRIPPQMDIQELHPDIYNMEVSALDGHNVEDCFIKLAVSISEAIRRKQQNTEIGDSERSSVRLSVQRRASEV